MQDLLVGIVGESLAPIVSVLLAAIFVVVLVVLVISLAKRLFSGRIGIGSSSAPRLAVVDAIGVDQRRKLVLLRRDGVEHLVLIGGPNDILVENNIGRAPPPLPQGTPRRDPEIALPSAPAPAIPAAPRNTPPVAPQPPVRATAAAGAAGVAGAAIAGGVAAMPSPAAPVVAPTGGRQESAPASREPEARPVPSPAPEPRRQPAPSVAAEDRVAHEPRMSAAPAPEREEPTISAAPAPQAAPRVEVRPQAAPARPPVAAAPVVAPPVQPQRVEQPVRPTPAASTPSAPRPHIAPSFPLGRATPVLPNSASDSAPAKEAPAPAEESPKPLSVRSFASTIQNRPSGETVPVPPPSAPEKQTPPAGVATPSAKPAATTQHEEDDGLEDLLATAFLDESEEPSRDEAARKDDQKASSVPEPSATEAKDEQKLSLEEEMERLLRDFTLQAGERR